MLGINATLILPGFSIKKVIEGNPIVFEVIHKIKQICIYCNSKHLRIKDKFTRKVRHVTIGQRLTMLQFISHKFYCKKCNRYFNERFPGILKGKRCSEPLRKQVYHHHTEGLSQKLLSEWLQIGKATVERWYQDYYWRDNLEIKHRLCPKVLGIDEHSFSKKQGYATTFCNLRKHKIFDVVKGKSSSDLKDYLLSLQGREKVAVVCIDLSTSYRSLIRKYFPNAKIVADRFHVIRLMNHMFLKTYQTIDTDIKYNRGTLALLRTNPENLTPEKKKLRDAYLAKQPAIAAMYHFKQDLHKLLMNKRRTAKQCKRLIPLFLQYIAMLQDSGFEHMRTLGNTLDDWQEEIARMWRFTKSNGITEGFHRKMKLIQRRAYGFRNFENYRLRVKVLCA